MGLKLPKKCFFKKLIDAGQKLPKNGLKFTHECLKKLVNIGSKNYQSGPKITHKMA